MEKELQKKENTAVFTNNNPFKERKRINRTNNTNPVTNNNNSSPNIAFFVHN